MLPRSSSADSDTGCPCQDLEDPGPDLGPNPATAPGSPAPLPGLISAAGGLVGWVSRLVPLCRTRLLSVARAEGQSGPDAFDAVQEGFVAFLTHPRAAALVGQAEASRKLLVTLVRNVARNRRRLHATSRPHDGHAEALEALSSDTPTVENLLVAAEERLRLAGCLRSLQEIPRAVVTLRMLEDVTGEQVAEKLGLRPGHVAVLLHRAKSSLLSCLTGR